MNSNIGLKPENAMNCLNKFAFITEKPNKKGRPDGSPFTKSIKID
jgi:hypothetical protein